MANYALTVTPKFTPFTYDELIKPIETYQKVYDTYDATYEKALEDASKFASLNAETDPEAYQRYQNYLQNIQNQRDVLFRTGLSNDSRRGFQNLRNTYATEIKPMEIAYDKKIEDIKNYDKMMMTNPQMRAVRNPHETTLSEYMSNPDLGNRYIDLNAVEKSAADAFSKAREKVIQYGHLDAETRDIITRVGLTPGEILTALDDAAKGGNTNAAKTINRITDEVRNQFGYDEIENESVRNDINATITKAAWNLRGDETHQYVTDAGAKRYLDYQDWKKKADYTQQLELEKMRAKAEAERTKNNNTYVPSAISDTSHEYKTTYQKPTVSLMYKVDAKGNLTSDTLVKLNKELNDYIAKNSEKAFATGKDTTTAKYSRQSYSTTVSNLTKQIENEERKLHQSLYNSYQNLNNVYDLYDDNIADLSYAQLANRVNLMNELENVHNTKTYRAYDFNVGKIGNDNAGKLFDSLTSMASSSKNIIKIKKKGEDTWETMDDADKTSLPTSSDIQSLFIVPEEGLIATDKEGNQYNLSQIDENISAKTNKVSAVQNMLNDFSTSSAYGKNNKEYYTPSQNSLNAVLNDYNNGTIPNNSIQIDNKNGLVKIYYNIKTGDSAFPNDLGIVVIDVNRRQKNGTYPIYTNRFSDANHVRDDESLKKLTDYTFMDMLVEHTNYDPTTPIKLSEYKVD